MLRGLYTAYTGMRNEQYRMDIMSNNLANADTTGFKKEGSTSQAYAEVMAVKIKDVSENPNTPRRLGKMSLGVKIGETFTDFSQGSLRDTGNTYDIAIGGSGFSILNLLTRQVRPLRNIQEMEDLQSRRTAIWLQKMVIMFLEKMVESNSQQQRAPQCLTVPEIFSRTIDLWQA